jgi:hypothetical protein
MTAPPPTAYWQYPGAPPPPRRPLLDQAVERMRAYDPRPWGAAIVVVPIATLAGLIVAGGLVAHLARPDSYTGRVTLGILLTVGLYAVLSVAVRAAGRTVAARYGGWGNAFGLRRPIWWDFRWIAAGVGIVFASRIAIGVVAAVATHGRANREAQNLELHTHSVLVYVVTGVVAVVLAPLIEETVFRGLLLRAFLRRMPFWPAAGISSAIFALFHTYEVSTFEGAVVLAAVTFALGLTNCLLVRWSERLTPGIAVHMLFNGLALAVLIATN